MAAGWLLNCGIYTITSPSGGVYVGSSVRISQRWKEHKAALECGKHPNVKLQNACQKYGLANLVFRKILLCPKQDLISWEQYFIDTLKPRYNVSPTAGSSLGVKRSSEFKENLSKRLTGKECPLERREKIRLSLVGKPISPERRVAISMGMSVQLKPVRCVETGVMYRSVREAAKSCAGSASSDSKATNIARVCSGERSTAYGRHWEYV